MRPNLFLATIGRGSNGSNALEVTEDRAAVTAESQDNIINRVNNVSQYGPSWHYVPGIGVAGTAYAEVPGSALGDLSFSRASSKTRTNAAGVVETIASNVPPHDYRNADGTLSTFPRLNLEPQRTNSIRNSSMVGAVAGTPGTTPTNWDNASMAGLTRTVVGIGTENGLPYIDLRFAGTASTATITIWLETVSQIAATNGQTWTNSVYAKLISGSAAGFLQAIREQTSVGGTASTGTVAIALTATLQRFTQTRTNVDATCAFVRPGVWVSLVSGQTYDFTIRIAAPQMELGAYATTWVPTTTAAVTRLADGIIRNNLFTNGIVTSSGGTWFIDLSNNLSVIRDTSGGCFLADSTSPNSGNQWMIRIASTPPTAQRLALLKYVSGTPTNFSQLPQDAKLAITWNGSTANVYVNGVKTVTDTAFTATNLQNLRADAVGALIFINQSVLFPRPLTDAECIQLTTL